MIKGVDLKKKKKKKKQVTGNKPPVFRLLTLPGCFYRGEIAFGGRPPRRDIPLIAAGDPTTSRRRLEGGGRAGEGGGITGNGVTEGRTAGRSKVRRSNVARGGMTNQLLVVQLGPHTQHRYYRDHYLSSVTPLPRRRRGKQGKARRERKRAERGVAAMHAYKFACRLRQGPGPRWKSSVTRPFVSRGRTRARACACNVHARARNRSGRRALCISSAGDKFASTVHLPGGLLVV